jgi:RNA polymerase sigma-70 factor (ECF subfamily)
MHFRAVRELWRAAESGDEQRLSEILDPKVAIVVESQDVRASGARVTYGVKDATTLLVHGMGARAGLAITPRSVNGQAGLLLTRDGEAAALVTVDFNGPMVSVVWIRLHPEVLRHGNRV